MKNEEYRILAENIAKQIESKIDKKPTIAIILGSGLADVVDCMENKVAILYEELDGMLIPNVKGHKRRFVIGDVGGKTVIAMQGRIHAYDGFSAKECVLPIYIFKLLGVESCIITNAAGAVNKSFEAGDIMLIKDHINNTGMNPLVGGAIIDFGIQFIDLNGVYTKEYRELFKGIAKKYNMNNVKEGTFMQVMGPSYETPAEVRAFRAQGADSVCMSTVLEVIACKQCGMKVLGISSISNKAVDEDRIETLTHEEVLDVANKIGKDLCKILPEFIEKI